MTNLFQQIKSFYAQIEDSEVIIAENNLLGFFKALERIEANNSHKNKVNGFNNQRNEVQYDDIRSSD